MGFALRKSIKIGKNTRVNLSSKGGVGISTGVKGARVSVNQQGAKAYGGVGPIRYQKNLSSNSKTEYDTAYDETRRVDVESYKGIIEHDENNNNNNKPKMNFFKKYYKEMIVVILALGIGSLIGSIGKVGSTSANEVKNDIEAKSKDLENKQAELDSLINEKAKLETYIKN